MAVPRCPDWPVPGYPDAPLGCGSKNVVWDGFEMWDCLDCGLFFTPDAMVREKDEIAAEGRAMAAGGLI